MITPYEKFGELHLDKEIEELADHVMDIGKGLSSGNLFAAEQWVEVALDKVEELKRDLISVERHITAAREQSGSKAVA